MDDMTQKIRERAHALWEAAGKPEGMENEHWAQAERETRSADPGDRQLDESLEETFPSSDPLSDTQPGGGITGPGSEK